jgi:methionine-rich copper-binding protein CopC
MKSVRTTVGSAKFILALLAVTATMASHGVALAHGQLEGSDPEDGARLKAAPPEVVVTYTEVPSDANGFRVKDGCGRNVIRTVAVEGNSIRARTPDAQPGTWLVRWDVISAQDGHETEGSLTFKVAGKPDCSEGTEPKAQGPGGGEESSGVSGTTLLLIGAGSVVLIAIALVVRRKS